MLTTTNMHTKMNQSFDNTQKNIQINNKNGNKLGTHKKMLEDNKIIYIEQSFPSGSRYQGFKLNGKRHGQGKFTFKDGSSYDGDWL